MSNKVDVLYEMERASVRLFDAGLHGDLNLDVAVAAVAELIEVADIALGWVNGPSNAEKAMRDRIRAALARVKGGEQ